MKLILSILAFAAFTANSQNLHKEFEEMNDYLKSLSGYSLQVSYNASSAEEIIEEGDVSVYVNSAGLLYRMGPSTMMINDEFVILVEDEDHTLIFSENQKVSKRKSVDLMDQMLIGIDSLITSADTIIYYQFEDNRKYTIRNEKAYFNMVEVSFKGKVVSKVDYYYNSDFVEESGIKTTCLVRFADKSTADSQFLDTNYYISEQNGEYVPSENFPNYILIYNEADENTLK